MDENARDLIDAGVEKAFDAGFGFVKLLQFCGSIEISGHFDDVEFVLWSWVRVFGGEFSLKQREWV